jgi:MoaA/NifB/PqqE/SkfB family radical SAM enzyme
MINKDFLFWLSRKANYPFVPPDIVQVSLTYRCNLHCKMCSIAGLLPWEEELTTEKIFSVINNAKKYRIGEILFTGGEPFLREDIFGICRYTRDKGLRSIITTNGTLIDTAMADAIVDGGADHIHFSLDGLGETNDFFRGKGAFDKAIAGIDNLSKRRKTGGRIFSIGIAFTVMDNNVKEIFEMVKLADTLELDVINFQPLAANNADFLEGNLSDFWLKEQNVPILEQEIEKIKKYSPRHITIYEEPPIDLLIKYYKRQLTKKDWVCFGGFKTAFICFSKKEPLVYSCHGICGNLNEMSLEQAWSSKEAHNLRLHSKKCKELCMQSCYSRYISQNPNNLRIFDFKKIKKHDE